MDASALTTFVFMRMAERILAVGIGGVSIYLGFRLFFNLPTETTSSGKIELPGYKVVISKAGPGIFFALFGTIVLAYSFLKAPSYSDEAANFRGAFGREPSQVSSEVPETLGSSQVSDQLRHEIALSLQMLNCMGRVVTAAGRGIEADDVDEPVRNAKVALLESVWDREKWGDVEDFRQWAAGLPRTAPREVRQLYVAVHPTCPES